MKRSIKLPYTYLDSSRKLRDEKEITKIKNAWVVLSTDPTGSKGTRREYYEQLDEIKHGIWMKRLMMCEITTIDKKRNRKLK